MFLEYCEGRTDDNYSMYLLKFNQSIKAKSTLKINKLLTIFSVLLLISSALFFSFKYFINQKSSLKTIEKVKADTIGPQIKTKEEYKSDT